jgi:hypothetical protein
MIIKLEPVPNQSISVTLEGVRYDIEIKDMGSVMAASITIDGEPVITGARCLVGVPLLPYKYMEQGNFIFVTDNNDFPDWRRFGDTQNLIYINKGVTNAD